MAKQAKGGNKKRTLSQRGTRAARQKRYRERTWPAHKLRNLMQSNSPADAKAWALAHDIIVDLEALVRRYRGHRRPRRDAA